jgi:hypothetical protein
VRVKRAELLPGDVLTIGRTDFVVQYEYRSRGIPIRHDFTTATYN